MDIKRRDKLDNMALYYQPVKTVMSSEQYMTGPVNYYSFIDELETKFDAIIIDGETNSRNECVKKAIENLIEGGIIVFDNFAVPRFDLAREYLMKWSIFNYPRKDGNTTAIITRFPNRKREGI